MIVIGGKMDTAEDVVSFALPYAAPAPRDENGDGRDDHLGLLLPHNSSNLTEGVDCKPVQLEIVTDEHGIATTWELFRGTDRSGTLIADGGPYGGAHTYVAEYCLAFPQDYVLYVFDREGNGLCCDAGAGRFRLSAGETLIRDSDGRFGAVDVTEFSLPADGRPQRAEETVAPAAAPTTRLRTEPL